MSASPSPGDGNAHDRLLATVRRQRDRLRHWRREGEPSVARFVGQIGVLGWIIVTPILVGLFLGRWLDRMLGSGLFWTAPLLLVGVVVGCWSAWRWIEKQ